MSGIGYPCVPGTCNVLPDVLGAGVSNGADKRGTLKKSKTSRYSSSFVAGVRDGVADLPRTAAGCRGWREIKKSKSYAHRLRSARIFTDEGVLRSPLVVALALRSDSTSSS